MSNIFQIVTCTFIVKMHSFKVFTECINRGDSARKSQVLTVQCQQALLTVLLMLANSLPLNSTIE